MSQHALDVRVGPGGWAAARCDDPPGQLLVRVDRDVFLDYVIVEVRFASTAPAFLTTRGLRQLPLGAVEQRLRTSLASALDRRMNEVPPPTTAELIAACDLRALTTAEAPVVVKPSSNLEYDEAFYRAVAARYAWHVGQGDRAPAPRIAAESGVPTSAVHRWITTCRDRGFLPKASTKGKVG